ncbi:MAG: hypothetical protein FWC89_05415, partial [Defluviitaleaceae bacterium]|nr:hypothetical protein [Defluviitaleaceae bacterium]
KPYPPSGELRLSDAFMGSSDKDSPSVELVVKVININSESLTPALQQNEEISGYSKFVDKVSGGIAKGFPLKESLHHAASECITEGILPEFFKKYRKEVESMFSLIWDDEMAKKVARREAIEDGIEIGIEKGIEKGIISVARKMLARNKPISEIVEDTGLSLETIESLV